MRSVCLDELLVLIIVIIVLYHSIHNHTMAQLEEHDVVVLTEDFKEFKKGSVGTIIYIYGGKLNNKVHALVEFENNDTDTIDINKLTIHK